MKDKQLIGTILNISRMHHTYMEKSLDQTGVFHVQHRILMYLSEHPGVAQTKIAENFHVSTATVAVSLKKLEAGGYITRSIDKNDKRYNCVSITEKGYKVVQISQCIFRTTDAKVLEVLSPEERELVGACLTKVQNHLMQLLAEDEPSVSDGLIAQTTTPSQTE
ncbi:MAG: MarR family winged helix-turn-helix transcriptional regulator [Lachnospiraceae bacterium]